jgi:hypothetical protein
VDSSDQDTREIDLFSQVLDAAGVPRGAVRASVFLRLPEPVQERIIESASGHLHPETTEALLR